MDENLDVDSMIDMEESERIMLHQNYIETMHACYNFGFEVRSLHLIELFARGRGVLPSKRLLRMRRWMGSHFHNWIDYNGITFLVELLKWGRTFSGFLG